MSFDERRPTTPGGCGGRYGSWTMNNRIEKARVSAGCPRSVAADHGLLNIAGQPTADQLASAADLFRVSVCWLMGHDDQVLDEGLVGALDNCSERVTDLYKRTIRDWERRRSMCAACTESAPCT